MIHIGFGVQAVASLQNTFGKERVIGFPIDFSVGNIENLHTDIGIYNYFNWAESTLHLDKTACDDFLESLDVLKNAAYFANNDLVIWVCNNASEQIGLRFVCALLPTELNITVINTAEAMKRITAGKRTQIEARHTGECSKEQLHQFLEQASEQVTLPKFLQLAEEGFSLLQQTSILRSYIGGKIVHEELSRDDEYISQIIKQNSNRLFKPNVMRIVGEVYATNTQYVSDKWLIYRVKCLMKNKVHL